MNETPLEPLETSPDAPPGRRARLLLWGGLLLVALLLAVGLWLAGRPAAARLQGEVEADEVNVATKTLSRVDRLLVAEGDSVRRGQLLAELSAPEVDNGARQAQAALASARALQSLAEEGARREDIESLRANWQAAQATADLAAVSAGRAERLFAQGVIAAQRRDEAVAARVSSARIAEAAKAQYAKALAGARPQNRAVAAAQVEAAAAGVSTAAALQQETRLLAPIDGEVARLLVREGEIVSPVLPALQLIEIARPRVLLTVREDDYQGLKVGRELVGEVPALGGRHRFRVTHVSPQGSFATWRATRQSRGYDVRAFEVKLLPVQPVEGLRPGMSVLFDWPQ